MVLLNQLNTLFKKHGVKIAYLFGSQKEKGLEFLNGNPVEVDRGSDLDVGIVFKVFPKDAYRVYGEIYADLVDLLYPFDVDIVFLQETNPLFQYEAIKGEIIFCDEQDFLDKYEELVMKKAEDLRCKKGEFEMDFLQAVKDGYFTIEHR